MPFPTAALEIVRHALGAGLETIAFTAPSIPHTARALGLVREIVTPDDLLSRARSETARLATALPEAYAHVKSRVRKPAVDRIAARRDVDDPEVIAMWSAALTRAAMRAALDRLARR